MITASIRRARLGLLLALAACALGATPALANGPVFTPTQNTPGTLDAGTFCSFAIDVTFPVNDETMKTFYDSAGNPVRSLNEGRLVVQMVNDSTGKTVQLNLSGPGQTVYNADGSQTITFLGNSALFLIQGSQPVLLLTQGRFVSNVPSGSLTGLGTLVFAAGRQANVCSVLS